MYKDLAFFPVCKGSDDLKTPVVGSNLREAVKVYKSFHLRERTLVLAASLGVNREMILIRISSVSPPKKSKKSSRLASS